MMQKTGSFVARDSAGREYTIDIRMDPTDGSTELRGEDGKLVARVTKGKYLMYWPIREVASDDPAAP